MPLRRRGSQSRRHPARRVPLPPRRHVPFELLVERALTGLPASAQRLLEQVAVVIEEEPTSEQLRENRLEPDDTLYGLYEGTPIVEYGADWVPLPNKISLFRLPLEADFADPDELAAEVRRTVLHELAHHAGFGEEGMRRLRLD